MAARTVRELIDRALRLIGALAVGETPSAADTAIALKVLQDLLAEKSGSLFVPVVVTEAVTLVANQASYTVGEYGTPDLATPRPEQIVNAWVRSGGYDRTIKIIDERNYSAIPDKSATGSPDRLWYNPTAPNGTLYPYPVPDAADTLYIVSAKALQEPSTLTQNMLDVVGIPRNYHRALAYMLAVDLAPEYGAEPSPVVIATAINSESLLVSLNLARTISPVIIEVGTENISGKGSILNF